MDTDMQQVRKDLGELKHLMMHIINSMNDDRREVRINNYYQ